MQENNIEYVLDEDTKIELVDSVISTPFKVHTHSHHYVFCALLEGDITFYKGAKSHLLKSGENFYILPNTPHGIDCTKPYRLVSLCLKEEYLFENTLDFLIESIDKIIEVKACFQK